MVAGSAPARLDPPLSGAAASATAGADHDTQGAALLAPGQLAALDPSPTKSIDMNIVGVPLCDTVNLGCSAAATRTSGANPKPA